MTIVNRTNIMLATMIYKCNSHMAVVLFRRESGYSRLALLVTMSLASPTPVGVGLAW